MWFKHPRYKFARSQFTQEVSASDLKTLHYSLPKIIFMCGGDEKYFSNRGIIENYLLKHHPLFLTFRAEYAWDVISKKGQEDKSINALSLEEWLADFSDIVIILVESFGTVAELGAFSLSPALRKKLLPIVNKDYEKDLSFINTGPITWVNKDSNYSPSIFTDFSAILKCMPEVEDRMKKRIYSRTPEEKLYGEYRYSKKVLLFFVLYVVTALGPITVEEVVGVLNDVISYKDKQTISFVLSIGVALKLFDETLIYGESYFTCLDHDKFFRDDSTHDFLFRIQQSRARSLSSLIKIPLYKQTLDQVTSNVT